MQQFVYPIIRKAEFSLPSISLKSALAETIANTIAEDSSKNIQKFVKKIEKIPNIKFLEIVTKAGPMVNPEGFSAFVVDYPRIRIQWKKYKIEVGLTTAVCYKKSSTKNWTRVSLLEGFELSTMELEKLKTIYYKVTDVCCNLSHKIFKKILKKVSNSTETSKKGNFTILTFGINDNDLGQQLDKFDNVDLRLKELFTKDQVASELIEDYYERLFNLKDLDLGIDTDKKFWITSSVISENKDGTIIDENVLYKVQSTNEKKIDAFGIVYDKSPEGKLAHLSSLNLAKFFAKEI